MGRENSGEGENQLSKACQISDEHDGGNVITQACMATSGTKLLVFVDDVT